MMTRQEMLAAIDAKAGAVRARYITIAPGQEATYILKGSQARRFVDSGCAGSPPSLVQAEASATGQTPTQAAMRIINEEDQWTELAAAIELARRRGKIGVTVASGEAEAEAAYVQTLAILKAMLR